jgi:hypothetical protein
MKKPEVKNLVVVVKLYFKKHIKSEHMDHIEKICKVDTTFYGTMYKSEKILTKHSVREFSILSTGKYITNGSRKSAYTVPVQNYIFKKKTK